MRSLPPLARLRGSLALLGLVVVVGAEGYHLISHTGVVDSVYMAVITLFTVGFREMGDVTTASKVFTILYLVAGLGVATYALSNLTALIVEGDLQGYLRERRMEKRLEGLKDHIIVCGLGKMGFQVALELKEAGIPFVVIESDTNKGRNPRIAGEIVLHGNAMNEGILEKAGIARAKGLITALTTDADNVLVVLTARQLNPKIPIVARNAKLGTERQLKAAGADHIVSPYEIGGKRMAALLVNPDMMGMFDVVLKQEQFELGLERIRVDAKSWMAGKVLREARIRDTTGALVVGIQRGDKPLLFNPQGAETFQAGDEVLVMGPTHALQAFMAQAKGEAEP
jgi:voltage-gated potassium channel